MGRVRRRSFVPSRFSLTGFLAEVDRVVVGTRQLPHYLSVLFVFGQPAVTGEAERLVHGLVPHVYALQVPARSRPCKMRLSSCLGTTWFNPGAVQCGWMAEVSSLHSHASTAPSPRHCITEPFSFQQKQGVTSSASCPEKTQKKTMEKRDKAILSLDAAEETGLYVVRTGRRFCNKEESDFTPGWLRSYTLQCITAHNRTITCNKV